jgi:CRISPR-associated protein Cas1
MPSLYVVQQNTKLRINNRRLQVEKQDQDGALVEVLAQVPLGQVDQVVLFGNVGLTTPAIDALLLQETEVVFLTQRGEYRGRLVGNITPHVPIRRAQYEQQNNPEFVLEMAKGFVTAKVLHQRALLMRHNKEIQHPEIEAAISQLAEALHNIPRKTALSSLMGVEGAATAAYFSGFRRLFGAEWNFNNRNRRPPADPINVLLSLGYTLMAHTAGSAVQVVGLDPYLGFLHEVAYNRPALALDLMEEFRPVVDGVVLWCSRGGQLKPQDFTPGPPSHPVILSEEGQRRFIQAFEQRMEQTFTHPIRQQKLPLRQCLIEQARQVANRLQRNEAGYTGMGFR